MLYIITCRLSSSNHIFWVWALQIQLQGKYNVKYTCAHRWTSSDQLFYGGCPLSGGKMYFWDIAKCCGEIVRVILPWLDSRHMANMLFAVVWLLYSPLHGSMTSKGASSYLECLVAILIPERPMALAQPIIKSSRNNSPPFWRSP